MRVLEHEMAHIALAEFFDHRAVVPKWFDEGFAEWAAGGMTCEGRIRVEIEVRRRTAAGLVSQR